MKSNKTTVTLEDLLRVKRAEQPPAEFWSQFERDMRAKQLAAIVEPRPWWAPLIRIGARASHFQLPVGAAAILVVSFITVREYRSPELNSIYVPKTAVQEVSSEAIVNLSSRLPSSENTSVAVLAPNDSAVSLSESVDIASAPVATGSISHSAQVINPPAVDREPSPSERYIAANLAAAQAADPSLMDDVFGPSMRPSQTRQPMRDPLAQVAASGESRRSRLLATALPVNAGSGGEAVLGANDRVARHLTEERLYDTISRVGLKGDRVAIKF